MPLGFGGGKSSSSQKIDASQKPWLKSLWRKGSKQADFARGLIDPTFGMGLARQGAADLRTLQDNPFLQSLQAQAGGNPALVQQQAGVLSDQLSRFSARQMNQATNTGISAGQFGSRGDVARGLVGEAATDAYAAGLSDIMTQDAQRSLQASTAGGGLLSQGILGGLGSLQGLLGTHQGGAMARMAPYSQLAGILGSPVVLGSQSAWNASFEGGS